MRLIRRLFVLFLLVTVFTFVNLVSPPSKAEDGVCSDTCDSKYDTCFNSCGDTNSSSGQTCTQACSEAWLKCLGKCRVATVQGAE